MRICLCDDEPQILKHISGKVKELVPNAKITEFADGRSLLNGLKEEVCDVLLLDIDLPDMAQHPDVFMYLTPVIGTGMYLLAYWFWKYSLKYYKSSGN